MAYETIGTLLLNEYEQEEEIETNLVADEETGVVEEVTTLIQPYAHVKVELVVEQDRIQAWNYSKFRATIYCTATTGKKGSGFSIYVPKESRSSRYIKVNGYEQVSWDGDDETYLIEPGTTKKFIIGSEVVLGESSNKFYYGGVAFDWGTYHDIDGILKYIYCIEAPGGSEHKDLLFNTYKYFEIQNLLVNGEEETIKLFLENSYIPETLPIERGIVPISADNFTDEDNATITYQINRNSYLNHYFSTEKYTIDEIVRGEDTPIELQIALSFDGTNIDFAYQNADVNAGSFTYIFTDADRELIRSTAKDKKTIPIYYIIKIKRKYFGYYSTKDSFGRNIWRTSSDLIKENTYVTERTVSIVGCDPILNPTVKDIKPETLALTSNENTLVQYESMVEFATGAVASKNAEIVSQSVQCGTAIVENLSQGVIDDIESNIFTFTVTDSRGLSTTSVLQNFSFIEYLKPTCYQTAKIYFNSDTTVTVDLNINGTVYIGSFGAADNETTVEVRYKKGSKDWGEWAVISDMASLYSDNSYEYALSFESLPYDESYTFQSRITDKLNVVESASYTLKLLPVFDWGENDFNFNVPVNINADELSMHNETIIRHSETTNNTVLSASGGHIYLRPGGTTSTTGESIIYSNGDISLGGVVDFTKGFTVDGNVINDIVIDSGTASMGSNGTWYWQKWASGKSECWGCRNYGRMAITTAWGNLYRSDIFEQELPDDVFVTTPDVININLVNITNGAWIVKHEYNAPSAVTTGSFICVRPASATPTVSYIGFHIIGLWKQ